MRRKAREEESTSKIIPLKFNIKEKEVIVDGKPVKMKVKVFKTPEQTNTPLRVATRSGGSSINYD